MNIIKESVLNVTDNSGAQKVKCIGLYKGASAATIGDVILVTIKKYAPNSGIKKGAKYKAVIVRVKQAFQRGEQTFRFNDNAVVLLDGNQKLVGNRIFGSTLREVKFKFPEITNIIQKTY